MNIYLDSAATTKIKDDVLEKMMPFLKEEYGNPGTQYELGRRARDAIENARQEVALTVGTSPEHIIFTGSGSAANNIAVKSMIKLIRDNYTDKLFATSALEHDSVFNSSRKYCDEYGVKRLLLHTKDGRPDIEELYGFGDTIAGISLMMMNNETGNVTPEFEHNGKIIHRDCVQSLGVIKIECDRNDYDFASFSAHKIGGPKGVGALFVKDKSIVEPVIYGGSGQEFGLYGGTENVAGIVGFGEACKLIRGHEDEAFLHGGEMASVFLDSLRSHICDKEKIHINSSQVLLPQRAKTVNIRLEDCDNETLIMMAEHYGVSLSAGSACSDHVTVPSRVLKEIGLADEEAMQSIRVSFSTDTMTHLSYAAGVIIAACYDIVHIN